MRHIAGSPPNLSAGNANQGIVETSAESTVLLNGNSRIITITKAQYEREGFMVVLNKPASGNTNWYQPVTDNWTALEMLSFELVET